MSGWCEWRGLGWTRGNLPHKKTDVAPLNIRLIRMNSMATMRTRCWSCRAQLRVEWWAPPTRPHPVRLPFGSSLCRADRRDWGQDRIILICSSPKGLGPVERGSVRVVDRLREFGDRVISPGRGSRRHIGGLARLEEVMTPPGSLRGPFAASSPRRTPHHRRSPPAPHRERPARWTAPQLPQQRLTAHVQRQRHLLRRPCTTPPRRTRAAPITVLSSRTGGIQGRHCQTR